MAGLGPEQRRQTTLVRRANSLDELDRVMWAETSDATTAFLLLLNGDRAGRLYVLRDVEQRVGRANDNDIRIEEKAVSHHHARLALVDGRYTIRDLGSTNGTYVNEQRVESAELASGDVIRIGSSQFVYLTPKDDPQERTVSLRRVYDGQRWAAPYQAPELLPAADAEAGAEGGGLDNVLAKLELVLAFLKRNRYLLIALAVIGFTLGCASTFLLPPTASAWFQVRLAPDPNPNPVERQERRNLQFFTTPDRTFGSEQVVRRTLSELKLDTSDKNVERTAERLGLRNVGPNLWLGSYTAGNRSEALNFLKTHMESFFQAEIDQTLKVISAEVDFLSNQLQTAETDLRTTEGKLREFREKYGFSTPEEAREKFAAGVGAGSRKGGLTVEIAKLRSEIELSEEKLNSGDVRRERRVQASQPYQAAIAETNRKLSEAKASGLGDQHPDVVQLRKQLNELNDLAKKTVEEGSAAVDVTADPEYAKLHDRIKALKATERLAAKELESLAGAASQASKMAKQLPEFEQQYLELTRNYDTMKGLYARLFEQLKSSKLQLDLERTTARARFNVILPPVAQEPGRRRTMVMRGAMGGAGFAVFGVLLAVGIELRRFVASRMRARRGLG